MIVPVILAGGSGTRLWPLSRESYPKQFCKIIGEYSLFQQTVLRGRAIRNSAEPVIVTSESYYFICHDQLNEIGISNAIYILEPCPRNTAAAIALAAHALAEDAMMLVMPSDHLIKDNNYFARIIEQSLHAVAQDKLVTLGIQPTTAETGYGYIEQGDTVDQVIFDVKRFVEKPNVEQAKTYLDSDNYFWNSGIFVFTSAVYLKELKRYAADIADQVELAFSRSMRQVDFLRVPESLFSACRSESIDYAVIEHTDNAVMLAYAGHWNDLGSWTAVAQSSQCDDHNNVVTGPTIVKQTQNCMINTDKQLVTAIGLDNIIIVATADAVLVADKAYAQSVKEVVAQLKSQNKAVADTHKKIYRSWGYYEQLACGTNYQVKHLMVKPGASLSLQVHQHRAEHWVVVSGIADVINGERNFKLHENQSTYIEKETKHRLSNSTDKPLLIIEIQSGSYLGEDDIKRFDDMYPRAEVLS